MIFCFSLLNGTTPLKIMKGHYDKDAKRQKEVFLLLTYINIITIHVEQEVNVNCETR